MLPMPRVEGTRAVTVVDGPALELLAKELTRAITGSRRLALRTATVARMSHLLQAIIRYANDNDGRLPDDLDDLVESGALKVNPATGGDPRFIYVRPAGRLAEIADPARTPILYESLDGRRNPDGNVGYADGHVEAGR